MYLESFRSFAFETLVIYFGHIDVATTETIPKFTIIISSLKNFTMCCAAGIGGNALT